MFSMMTLDKPEGFVGESLIEVYEKDERSRYENHAGITRREHRDRIKLDSNTDIYQFCFWNTF